VAAGRHPENAAYKVQAGRQAVNPKSRPRTAGGGVVEERKPGSRNEAGTRIQAGRTRQVLTVTRNCAAQVRCCVVFAENYGRKRYRI